MINCRKNYLPLVLVMGLLTRCHRIASRPELEFTVHKPIEIEVGGPLVGVEFHRGKLLPQRISFYYPVANSLDHSQDYWTRDTSLVLRWQLLADGKVQSEFGTKPDLVRLSPYAVVFEQKFRQGQLQVEYHFCAESPVMVTKISIRNTTGRQIVFTLGTEISTVLRTCHTYRSVAPTSYWCSDSSAIFEYADPDIGSANLFLLNVAELPAVIQAGATTCHLRYERCLEPGGQLQIVWLLGSARPEETTRLLAELPTSYADQVGHYEQLILAKSWLASTMHTGSAKADFSAAWAKAILETNRHYLDQDTVPMPCPAEYNFYFTHDVLVTDLAAVNYDLERVQKDLQFIERHAALDGTIPHAYYWKDGRYQTEYAGVDNWNNQWFVILVGRYLRHSADLELGQRLYPLLTRSIQNALRNKGADDLVWSRHPDWWDIGDTYGPRAYMTILTIQALREYSYITRILNMRREDISQYLQLAQSMQKALTQKLWSDKHEFLMNYNADGKLDEHYFAGSLLAAHYGLLDAARSQALVATAKAKLLVPDLGVQVAYPPDFHLWGDYYRFVGNEVGAPYYYLNGGIWANGNAWYALALLAIGNREAAADFVEQTMAITGIAASPNGQPAYYEVRSPNLDNPELYGTVDKPQFMWAGGWYLYCLYQLLGVDSQNWNIALTPNLPRRYREANFTLTVNGSKLVVKTKGRGEVLSGIQYDGIAYPSAVFPTLMPRVQTVELVAGKPQYPYLQSTTAILKDCRRVGNNLMIDLASVPGFAHEAVIISPQLPRQVVLNGNPLTNQWRVNKFKNYYRLTLQFDHETADDQLIVQF